MSGIRTPSLVQLAVGGALAVTTAQSFAQSTASQLQDQLVEVVVSSQRAAASIDGLIQAENAAKSRSSITAEYLATQAPGQSVIQSLNLLPGVNFTNSDPFGASGGNIRMRSFDGNRISLMLDGVQLNDTGNYAIYTNQQVDPEIIDHVTVNLGTTDVDSPTASATGGTINIVTQVPRKDFGVSGTFSGGSNSFLREFGRIDTGAFGPFGTRAYVTVSNQSYDKFKGPGELKRLQFNAKIFQDIGEDSFVSLAAHYNRNRNAFYRNPTLAQIASGGIYIENDPTCTRVPAVAGTAQNDALCSNYYNVRINPSNTGNIRGQVNLKLTDTLRLTIDPSFQYTQANGGGYTGLSETDGKLRGPTATGVDLNGDGDTLDTVGVYSPNNTNTNRYTINSSLLWTFAPDQLLAASYVRDYGRHRQTGQFGPLDANGNPENIFGGRDGQTIKSADGVDIRGRDRFSIAELNQGSISYVGHLFDRQLGVNVGIRYPFFHRDLNQYCYTIAALSATGTAQSGAGNAYCTTQVPVINPTTGLATFPGSSTRYITPFVGSKDYSKLLPNIGVSFSPGGGPHQFYVSFSEGLSAPRTDNLYSVQIQDVAAETTKSYETGYRFHGSTVTTSAALWYTDFENRIVTSFDELQGLSVDRNVGDVKIYGFDGEIGWQVSPAFSVYASGSYNHSDVQGNIQASATSTVSTAGKKLVETPDYTLSTRLQYKIGLVEAGLQGKYVASRFATDVNDLEVGGYFVADLDVRAVLDLWSMKNVAFQFNVTNLFDRTYLGSISSRFNAFGPGAQAPTFSISAPRTFLGSVSISY